MRPTTCPDSTEVTNNPTTSGNVRTPDTVADTPSTYCRYAGKYVIAPSIANPTMKLSTEHTVKIRLLNRFIGSIGSAARRSTATKFTSSTTASTNNPMITGDVHGYSCPPNSNPRISADTPTATSAIPA